MKLKFNNDVVFESSDILLINHGNASTEQARSMNKRRR
jgi:hypothetical protein